MEIPQATCHLEFEKDIIEERMEWFYYRVQHMKCGLNYKLRILKNASHTSLRTYIRVHYLLGEPI
jgi:hypothetical protein